MPPTLQRACAHTQTCAQPSPPPPAQILRQRTHQQHQRTGIASAAKEAHRRRGHAPATAFARTAKAQSAVVALAEQRPTQAKRLAWITRTMQHTLAVRAASASCLCRLMLIESLQVPPKTRVREKRMTHWDCLFCFGRLKRQPSRGLVCKLLEGALPNPLTQSETNRLQHHHVMCRGSSRRCVRVEGAPVPAHRNPRTTRANAALTNAPRAVFARPSSRSCLSPTAARLRALGGSVRWAFGLTFSNGVSLDEGSSVHCVPSGGLFGDRNGCGYPI